MIHPYLIRTLQLARLGGNRVCPNPQVGAIVVHNQTIIGEGYHAYYGGPHAEVVAIKSVPDPSLLAASTLYVSLEPCNHHGRTPPCTELILKHQIPRVVIGCKDPNPKVSGKGIQRLKDAGVEVIMADDPDKYRQLNRVFWINQLERRPFITLKWAETADGYIAGKSPEGKPEQVLISGFRSMMLAHRLRAEHHAIMIGRNTATIDDPRLTTRLYYGENPLRIVFDRHLKLSPELGLFKDGMPSLILNEHKDEQQGALRYFMPTQWTDMAELIRELYRRFYISSILVEGGSQLLQQFIDQEVFDQLFRFQSLSTLGNGIPGPRLPRLWHFKETCEWGEGIMSYGRRGTP